MKLLIPLLTTLFIGLKLTGHIAWSWWWVLGPLWIPIAIILPLIIIALGICIAFNIEADNKFFTYKRK